MDQQASLTADDLKNTIDHLNVNKGWKRHFWHLARLEVGKQTGETPKIKYSERGFGFINALGIVVFGPLQYFILGMWKRGVFAVGLFAISVAILYYILALAGLPSKAVGFLWYAFVGIIPADYYQYKVKQSPIWDGFKPVENPLAAFAISIACIVGAGFIMSSVNTPDDLMEEVSGVWRDGNNKIVEIRLEGTTKKIIYDGNTFSVSLKRGGNMDGIVVLNVVGQPKPWTIREVKDGKGSFTLTLTVNDTDTFDLNYVRP